MKRLSCTLALATILFVSACHNAGSSTAQETEDATPAKMEAHGETPAKAEGHGEAPAKEETGAASHAPAAMDTTAPKDSMHHQH